MSQEERMNCPRCRGYGVVGWGDEPGCFYGITEDPCTLCKGARSVTKVLYDSTREKEQRERDLRVGHRPSTPVLAQLRRRLKALEIVEEALHWTSEMKALSLAIRELERLDRLVNYREEVI